MTPQQLQTLAAAAAPSKRPSRKQPRTAPTLRERAWWLMRQQRKVTLNDLLNTVAESTDRSATHSLTKYIGLLERVGVLARLPRKVPGLSPLSRGHVIWRLAHDLGRLAPVGRYHDSVLLDPNSGKTLAPGALKDQGLQPPPEMKIAAAEQRVAAARAKVLQAIQELRARERHGIHVAITKFIEAAREGRVAPEVASALSDCMVRAGRSLKKEAPGIPSQRTLFRWLAAESLTPISKKGSSGVKPWHAAAVRLRRRRPTTAIQALYRHFVTTWRPEWGRPISDNAFRRFLQGPFRQLVEATLPGEQP